MKTETLKEKRVALIKQMEDLTDGKEQLTDEERIQFDELDTQVATLDSDIKRAEKLDAEKKAQEEAEVKAKAANIPGAQGGGSSEQDEKDMRKYSIRKAILKKAESQQGVGKFDGIELEMHQEAVREGASSGQTVTGLGIPSMVLEQRADLKATVDAQGGYTVATDTVGFIETLKNNMATIKAGAIMMPGLVGDVSIPRLATDSVATWRTEGGVAKQSDPTFEAVTMTPHRLTTYTEYTMQLLKQSTLNIDKIVSDTLFYSIANALETAGLEGSGTSQVPAGILNASVNDATHGSTNPTLASYLNIVNMEKMIAVDNALVAKMAYIMKASAAAKLKTTPKVSSTDSVHIWENDPLLGGVVNGYPALVTNVYTDDTIIFGDWTALMYGQWGGLDLLVNPYSLDTYATVRVIIAGYFDVALKHPESFSRIDDLKL